MKSSYNDDDDEYDDDYDGTKFPIFNEIKNYDVVCQLKSHLLNIFDRCQSNKEKMEVWIC